MMTCIPQIGSVVSCTYFAGSASKCSAQRELQNRIVCLACSRLLPGFSGLTAIPQIGSVFGLAAFLELSWPTSEVVLGSGSLC